MRIVAVTMVRDEADIIGRTIEHLLAEGVDEVIVADNLSADGTSEILAELARTKPVTVRLDEEVGYFQDRKMTRLAWVATSRHGADWVIPFDADEFWCAADPAAGSLRDVLAATEAEVLYAATHHHPPSPDPHLRLPEASPRAKVCFRWEPGAWLHMGNHDVEHFGPREDGQIAIHEFQYRSFEQFQRKVRNGAQAFAATDLPETTGSHWRVNGVLSDEDLLREWESMFDPPGLVRDPWQPSVRGQAAATGTGG